jgi:peptide deformylase
MTNKTTHTKAKRSLIVDRDAPVLRKVAAYVPPADIRSKKIQDVISRMQKALALEDDGVAIAAPQINESLRIFIVSGRALSLGAEVSIPEDKIPDDMVCINPEIVRLSKKKNKVEEGCLSVRWLYGKVLRSEKARIRAFDEHGKRFERGGTGLMAQIFQHEIDHLDGVLFIDKAEDIEDIPPKHTANEKRN